MSRHTYTRVWLHLIWGTLKREKLLNNKDVCKKLSYYLYNYSNKQGIFMDVNYINPDHVHVLVDLPTNLSLESMMQNLKGSSSHWINQNELLPGKFAWGRGYSIFSVSHSSHQKVKNYILNQFEHHKTKTFVEEYNGFINRHGIIAHKAD